MGHLEFWRAERFNKMETRPATEYYIYIGGVVVVVSKMRPEKRNKMHVMHHPMEIDRVCVEWSSFGNTNNLAAQRPNGTTCVRSST